MGIQITCEGETYTCGYTSWMVFREEVGHAAIRYLQNLEFPECEEPTYLEKSVKRVLDYVEENNCGTVPDYLYLLQHDDYLNTFVHYQLGGVFALLNKSDDDGCYSVGNAVDILDTFRQIDTLVEDTEVKSSIESLTKVFEQSVQHKKMAMIY